MNQENIGNNHGFSHSSDLNEALLSNQMYAEEQQHENMNFPRDEMSQFVPCVGQCFKSFEEIETLLEAFGKANNFMVIIMRSQRPAGHVIQATFGCYKSGSYRPNKIDTPKKRTVKTNCPFQINVRYSEKASEYRITKVDLEHNHELDMADMKTNAIRKSHKRKTSGDNLEPSSPSSSPFGLKLKKPRRSKKGKNDEEVSEQNLSGVVYRPPELETQEDHLILDEHSMQSGHPDFDLLSGLELPDEIAQEVSAAMQDII